MKQTLKDFYLAYGWYQSKHNTSFTNTNFAGRRYTIAINNFQPGKFNILDNNKPGATLVPGGRVNSVEEGKLWVWDNCYVPMSPWYANAVITDEIVHPVKSEDLVRLNSSYISPDCYPKHSLEVVGKIKITEQPAEIPAPPKLPDILVQEREKALAASFDIIPEQKALDLPKDFTALKERVARLELLVLKLYGNRSLDTLSNTANTSTPEAEKFAIVLRKNGMQVKVVDREHSRADGRGGLRIIRDSWPTEVEADMFWANLSDNSVFKRAVNTFCWVCTVEPWNDKVHSKMTTRI